jgi:hypothetical protein
MDQRSLSNLQIAMAGAAADTFDEEERARLRCLIRIVVEFASYVIDKDDGYEDWSAELKVRFHAGSTFSAIQALDLVTSAYVVRSDALPSEISVENSTHLNDQYRRLYDRFLAEDSFDRKCRLLLDLFKLQLAILALSY